MIHYIDLVFYLRKKKLKKHWQQGEEFLVRKVNTHITKNSYKAKNLNNEREELN